MISWPRLKEIHTHYYIGGLAIILVLGSGLGLWLVANTKPIPEKFRQGLNFPVYYPYNLPRGYSVAASSFTRKGRVLIFSIHTPISKDMIVTEEHIPVGVDLSNHANPTGLNLQDEDNFTTSIGTGSVSLWGINYVASLVTPDTWLIINVTGFTARQAELVVQAFTPL